MSKVTSVNLGDHFGNFVSDLTESGRYKNASEAVRAGLRLLEDQEKYSALNALLVEGEESGESEQDFDQLVNQAIALHE